MHILLLRHYPLSEGPSMAAFVDQIVDGLKGRYHTVEIRTAPVLFGRLAAGPGALRKWLGYLDQFVLFPPLLWLRSLTLPSGSLCVLADQALAPWILCIKHRPVLVHVHDLLSLEAALGKQPFHLVGLSGRLYQLWIRQGFRQARCFLSVSESSRAALARQLTNEPLLSEVLYNSLPYRFSPTFSTMVVDEVEHLLPSLSSHPFLFHIGRNWYKNRLGLLSIWEQLCLLGTAPDLVLVGALETSTQFWIEQRPDLQSKLHVLPWASNSLVMGLYSSAKALLFPSHAEGFGWPILEAMACGCPVVTTDRPPMSEVGGNAVTYIPPCPLAPFAQLKWAREAAECVLAVLQRTPAEQQLARERGFRQARRFDYARWLEHLEVHYQRALDLQEEQL